MTLSARLASTSKFNRSLLKSTSAMCFNCWQYDMLSSSWWRQTILFLLCIWFPPKNGPSMEGKCTVVSYHHLRPVNNRLPTAVGFTQPGVRWMAPNLGSGEAKCWCRTCWMWVVCYYYCFFLLLKPTDKLVRSEAIYIMWLHCLSQYWL